MSTVEAEVELKDRAIQLALGFAGRAISESDGTYDLLITVAQDAMREWARRCSESKGERSLEEMGEEYKILNHLSEKWEAEKARIIEEEREACRSIAEYERDRARRLQDERGENDGRDLFRQGITQGRAQAAALIELRIRNRSKVELSND